MMIVIDTDARIELESRARPWGLGFYVQNGLMCMKPENCLIINAMNVMLKFVDMN